ncbi:hypothetical protein KAR91_82210 [Candidatus Pacearchaeota archaeon]|nr:hypothetical protein [Candidatus Pacearchaeota archaeon]
MSNKIVKLFPGLESHECSKIIEKTLDERDYCDYQCYQLLKQFLDGEDAHPLRHDNEELFMEMKSVVAKRELANNKFLEACAGRIA